MQLVEVESRWLPNHDSCASKSRRSNCVYVANSFLSFFTQGSCSFGDNCFYSHDPENSITVPPDSCWFYICTHCRFGDNCEKKHISKEEILRLNSSSKGDSPSKVISIEASKSSGDCQQQQQPNSANIPSVSAAEAAAAFKSYASAVGVDANSESVDNRLLCSSYLSQGYCNFPRCNNVHGDLCDLCGFYALHPFNEQLRQKHRDVSPVRSSKFFDSDLSIWQECMAEHERSMELAFAYQRSQDLVCGICFEIVIEKEPKHSSRFGILENCNHIYCVDCIRAWRNSNSSETSKSNKRVCPMCRIKSDFIIPSEYFYDDKEEEKQKLITRYKDALRLVPGVLEKRLPIH